ncbi:MAG: hypothetical protein CL671_03175 [Balneola sp.]|nr:hypothetical protein [Balneola sp.]MAC06627.1 hypothetical protein [Balneola sp.]MAO78935.1 hypothetical protein [Balneola sp.]MBF63594.1 hypothetical protein [Balneola sp.]HAW80320.1 hypothetical protein [Balneola sp.]|tara:strand:- start:1053 stop:1502 length:450 start_codon:yes stop_codon:yes gene_type:complete
MSEEYKPIPNSEQTFILHNSTPNKERQIHEIQVRYPAVELAERKAICNLQKWKPEERIPELSQDIRIEVSALQGMIDRHDKAKQKRSLQEELADICDRYKAEHNPPDSLSPEEYWYQLACVLFVEFKDLKVDKGELDYKEIQRAYADFM